MSNFLEIIQPDDWHIHFREGDMLELVTNFSSRINNRCVAMPNTIDPITTYNKAKIYKEQIKKSSYKNFEPLIPCYLKEDLEIENFREGLKNKFFFGAKLYPCDATTNSKFGVNDISKIFYLLEILEQMQHPLLIHGEKVSKNIDIFDREKFFIDDELTIIRDKFPNLKITLEHVTTAYGVHFIKQNNNIGGTITPHHMLLTKDDVFIEDSINPHHYCMPVAKNESDLIELRNAACHDNSKFFLGTDSAPHPIEDKSKGLRSKPGIFTSPCSIELYAEIFEQENAINNLERFSSINGAKFYGFTQNKSKIRLQNTEWIIPEFSELKNIKVKNFFANKKINWKVIN
mgnify:FL=1